MPTYVFEDTRTGKTVELVRRVADRDDVPAHLKRIVAPNLGGQGFMGRDSCREPGVDEAVPKAFREMELQGHSYRKICREAGFSVDHVRRVWNFLAVCACLLGFTAPAADITAGYVFTDTDHVTASKVNSAAAGTIGSAFITGKDAASGLNSADLLVLSQSGTLKRLSISTLQSSTNVIDGRSEATSTLTNDYLLVLNNGVLAKVQLGSMLSKISGIGSTTGAPNTNNFIFTANNGATAGYASIQAIGGYLFTSYPSNINLNSIINVAHTLPGTPQAVRFVLMMTNLTGNDNGYVFGDELDVGSLLDSSLATPLAYGTSATNVFLSSDSTHNFSARPKAGGAYQVITKANWQAKAYARYWTY